MNIILRSFCFLTLVLAFACSSQKKVTTKVNDEMHKNAGKTTEWDYNKIRDVQKEEAKLPPPPDAAASLSNVKKEDCLTVTESQVQRGKLEGCKKLDPKEGFGENMYCCPTLN